MATRTRSAAAAAAAVVAATEAAEAAAAQHVALTAAAMRTPVLRASDDFVVTQSDGEYTEDEEEEPSDDDWMEPMAAGGSGWSARRVPRSSRSPVLARVGPVSTSGGLPPRRAARAAHTSAGVVSSAGGGGAAVSVDRGSIGSVGSGTSSGQAEAGRMLDDVSHWAALAAKTEGRVRGRAAVGEKGRPSNGGIDDEADVFVFEAGLARLRGLLGDIGATNWMFDYGASPSSVSTVMGRH